MKATELRIGNYVMHEPTVDDFEVIKVKAGTIIQCEISPDSFETIAITEEWILKFGFRKVGPSRYGVKYSFQMADWGFTLEPSFEQGKWFFGHEFYDAPDESWNNQILNFCFDLQYVHTLQNIFHSLTGEELYESK